MQGIIIFQEITANLIALKQSRSVIAGVVFIAVIFQHTHIGAIFHNRLAVTEGIGAILVTLTPVHREIAEEIFHRIFQCGAARLAILFKGKLLLQSSIFIGQICPLWQKHIAPQHRCTGALPCGNIAHIAIIRHQGIIERDRCAAALAMKRDTFIRIGIDEIGVAFLAAPSGRHNRDIIELLQLLVCFQVLIIFQIFLRSNHKIILHDNAARRQNFFPISGCFLRRCAALGQNLSQSLIRRFQKRTIPHIIGIIDRKGAFALPNRVTGSKKDIPVRLLLAEAQLLRQGIKKVMAACSFQP